MKRFLLVTAILSLSVVASSYAFDDWPQWRGQKRDGISAERGLLKDWPAGGPPLAWFNYINRVADALGVGR